MVDDQILDRHQRAGVPLADLRPTLFDKYLYVGATRAATYLGLTCTGAKMPDVIERVSVQFGDHW